MCVFLEGTDDALYKLNWYNYYIVGMVKQSFEAEYIYLKNIEKRTYRKRLLSVR